jgi:hypothetical protein
MRVKKLLVALLLVVSAVITVAVLLTREEGGPIPSETSLANYGLAVWPADTLEEAQAECADAQLWRLDARATARQFAGDVLKYPAPTAGNAIPGEDHVRYLVNSRGIDRVFLGSVLDLRRYGRCWYVVQGQPRESSWFETTSVGFVQRDGEPKLLISRPGGIPETRVGYGSWERTISAGANRAVVDIPALEEGATGHVIFLDRDENGVSEYVYTERLGALPAPSKQSIVRPLGADEVADNPKVCRIESSPYRSGKAVVRHLFQWTFDALLEQEDGYPSYERRRATLVRPPDRWKLLVDDATLDLTIPEIANRCWKLVSMSPRSGEVIREFRVGPRTVTLHLDWGNADSALIFFGTEFDGRGGTLARLDGPITFFRQAAPQPADVPTYALVVLYKDQHIMAAQYGLYGP